MNYKEELSTLNDKLKELNKGSKHKYKVEIIK